MSKRQEMRDKRRKQQQTQRIVIGSVVLLGALLVALAFILPNLTAKDGVAVDSKPRPQADFNAMGDPNAPITITEYSDYKCGHCAAFAFETEAQLVEEYIKTGKVYFIYRSMADWINPQSLTAIEASYCAGDENKFWEFHDIVFANQELNFSIPQMSKWADQLGLDVSAFDSCLKSGKYTELAKQDGIDGAALGVQGTPTFFITYKVNGEEKQRVLPGAYPMSGFKTELDAALAEMGQ